MFLARGTGVLPSLAFGVWKTVVCSRDLFSVYFFLWFLVFAFLLHWPMWAFYPHHPCRKVPAPVHLQPHPQLRSAHWVGVSSGMGVGKGLLKNSNKRKKYSLAVCAYSDSRGL